MKRRTVVGAILALVAGLGGLALARPGGGGGGARGGFGGGAARGGGFHGGGARPSFTQALRPSPVVIRMGSQGSGWHDRNFPVASPRFAAAGVSVNWPSWGHGWSSRTRPVSAHVATASYAGGAWSARPVPGSLATVRPAGRLAVAQHHHPYTPGYVRQRLRKVGVTSEPALITDRSEMIHTNAAHSVIAFPAAGPGGAAIRGSLIKPAGMGAAVVRADMARVSAPGFAKGLGRAAAGETARGRYYWHRGGGFDYCHYQDAWGYQWYGWYQPDGFFWTRYFDGRWWWFDQGEARWCYYNDGYWWWQDPYHVGDLYCYNDGDYIPANSADDQILVSLPETEDMQAFLSPDGTRTVKLVAGGEDAFLYDTSSPPAFDPVYLASGVSSVQFSDPGDGRPLEIMLKLDDGSFDLFDADGNPYNPGGDDAQAAQQPAPGPNEGD